MRIRWMVLFVLAAPFLTADEGLWLFEHFPKQQVRQKYGFTVTDAFLRHLQLASVRFNNGGSGSFVSPRGLLFTNHHVGADCIQKLSTAGHDYMANGFYAVDPAAEQACPDLEVNVLLRTEDVTARINSGVNASIAASEANQLRKAATARMEKECAEATKNRCDVVTLYSGAQYSLYQYKKYTDIRLVFAPEYGIAAFGGDPDNFTYPRYCLDFALFRAYENGKPVSSGDYLKWSHEGVKDGELTFVSGNPGSTGRLNTVSQLEFQRDVAYPFVLSLLKQSVDALLAFSQESTENKRIATEEIQGRQNGFKAITGFEGGLQDPQLMERKKAEEQKLRIAISKDAAKEKQYGGLWDQIASAEHAYAAIYPRYSLIESSSGGSTLLHLAKTILRFSEEKSKPNEQRLRGYQDAALPSLEQEMYSPAPIYPPLEKLQLGVAFRFMQQTLGADDPIVRSILNGRSPTEVADYYVSNTKLADLEERKRLAATPEAARSSKDAMMELARILDAPGRKLRKEYEDKVESVLASAGTRMAQARFAVYGDTEAPDATFTLRLTYGPVRGYTDKSGKKVPWDTTFAGLYQRASNTEPYQLPPRWKEAKSALDLNTPFDFVTTDDTHGGNSGSPTVNTRSELIGILFDGNIEGLPNRYVFTEQQARSVHVAGNGIIEALKKVYKADRILTELGF